MKTSMRLLGVASVAFFLLGKSCAQSLASYVRTDKPEAVIDIRAGSKVRSRFLDGVWDLHGERRQRDLWGLAAQLLENPSLETTTPACRR